MGFAQYDVNKIEAKDVKMVGTDRVPYFSGIGKDVNKATSVETAISLSGLDFQVKKMPIAFISEVPTTIDTVVKTYVDFPDQYATVRTDTMKGIGIVGKNYEILQNAEAFDFLDSMVGEAKFETAGSYGHEGAKSFITMSTEPMQIMGDEFKPYILFTNSFDGSGCVKVMFTPIRVFCSNCLVRAIKAAENKISIRHSSTLKTRLENAKYVLLENTKYMDAIKAEAEKQAITPYSTENFRALVQELFGPKEDESKIMQARAEALIEAIMACYNQQDLQNFNNTAYKAIQAIADFESHRPAFRDTKTLMYKNIGNIMQGMPLTNQIANRIMAA